MAPLSVQDILRLWEAGGARCPADRALQILEAASPGVPAETLATLPVGLRDARLLEIREETFGPTLHGVSPCPRCAERAEFKLEIADLRARVGSPASTAEGELCLEDWSLRYRQPTGGDLAEAARSTNAAAARGILATRCILEARKGGAVVGTVDVPEEAISRMAVAMVEQDPYAEILLDFVCPACGHAGQTLFDIASYLWEEIRAQAQRLLHEVHTLARAYGWREGDVLALSAARRRYYLELAT